MDVQRQRIAETRKKLRTLTIRERRKAIKARQTGHNVEPELDNLAQRLAHVEACADQPGADILHIQQQLDSLTNGLTRVDGSCSYEGKLEDAADDELQEERQALDQEQNALVELVVKQLAAEAQLRDARARLEAKRAEREELERLLKARRAEASERGEDFGARQLKLIELEGEQDALLAERGAYQLKTPTLEYRDSFLLMCRGVKLEMQRERPEFIAEIAAVDEKEMWRDACRRYMTFVEYTGFIREEINRQLTERSA